MKHKLLSLLVAAICLILFLSSAKAMDKTRLFINNHPFSVEIAKTPDEQIQGLQHRHSLAPSKGMLFPIVPAMPMTFWMKDCDISLDILFFANNKLVYFVDNAPPCNTEPSTCPRYASPVAVDNIVELKAGTRQKLKIEPGAKLVLSK